MRLQVLFELPAAAAFFDVVLLADVLEHLPEPQSLLAQVAIGWQMSTTVDGEYARALVYLNSNKC